MYIHVSVFADVHKREKALTRGIKRVYLGHTADLIHNNSHSKSSQRRLIILEVLFVVEYHREGMREDSDMHIETMC